MFGGLRKLYFVFGELRIDGVKVGYRYFIDIEGV